MGRIVVVVLVLAAFCLGAAISYFNWRPVSFHYLAGEIELPLIALLFMAFIAGLVVMGFLNLARMFLLGRETRRQARQINELETELKNLRNLPLAGSAPAAPMIPPGKNAR